MDPKAVREMIRELRRRHARMRSRDELKRQLARLRLTTAPPVIRSKKD